MKNNEAKPQKLFYISEFLQTIEELHTNEGFAKMLEKGITCGQVDHKGKISYYYIVLNFAYKISLANLL